MQLEPIASAWLDTESGESIPLRGICTFGRTAGNTVVLPVPKASRRHAMIHQQGGEFWVVDLCSTNGIEINGVRVTHPAPLRAGDRLQMPGGLFVFRDGNQMGQSASLKVATHELTMPEIRMVKCWILLADLQGFTKMSQQLPAGELAPLVGQWMAHCQEILQNQKGVLAKFLGDGFMAYWVARDDAAPRIAHSCREFRDMQRSAPLPFRIVLHYGEVSFGGRSLDASNTMMGTELNFAFRLEKVASRLKLLWIFSDTAADGLRDHLHLVSCGPQAVPDFEFERTCFTLGD